MPGDNDLLVSPDALKKYMSSIGLTPDQAEGVHDVLTSVQDELRAYLNRPLIGVDVTGERVTRTWDGLLLTRHTPVVNVTSIAPHPGGSPLATGAYRVEDGLIKLEDDHAAARVVDVSGPGSRYRRPRYTVSYRASLIEAWPASKGALRAFIFRVAAREVQNLHDDVLSAQDLSTTQEASPVPPGPTDDDYRRVQRYRRLKAVTSGGP